MSIFDAMNAKPKFRQLVTLVKKVFTEVRNTLDPGSSVSPIDFCVVRLLSDDGLLRPAGILRIERRVQRRLRQVCSTSGRDGALS